MKTWTLGALVMLLGLCVSAFASSAGPSMQADEALKLLKDGNARYVAAQSTHSHQGADRRAETVTGGQHPFATIIGCSDSRAPLEVIFDQGVGDIFVVRVAGNVAGSDELGTVEYGVGHLGTPVVLVLGHTACGAVTAAAQNAKVHGNIPFLINQIKPAVAKAKAASPTASGDELVSRAITANVWLTIENIFRKSEEVREFVTKGKLLVVGGVYDLHSGQVSWLGAHPDQGKFLAAAPKGRAVMKAKHAPAPVPAPAKQDAASQGSMVDPAPAQPAKAAPAHP
ncbi:MAG: carbonic anhydrase [Desulfovibrio sp.]|nr:carbonic anhydrase [Desulfovibrio sp.]